MDYRGYDGTVSSDRTAANFKLVIDALEQGSGVEVALCDKSNEPISVVLVVQLAGAGSASVLNEVKAGFRRIEQSLAAILASNVSVLAYAGDSKRLLTGGAPASVEGTLAKLIADAAAKDVHLLDALQVAIDLLESQAEGRRKLIVVISDGVAQLLPPGSHHEAVVHWWSTRCV